MNIDFDVELFLTFLANSIAKLPALRKDFEEYYHTDKYRFYERAKRSQRYNDHTMSDQTLELEVPMKWIFGILLCAEEAENVREFVVEKLLNANPRFRELVENPAITDLDEFIYDTESNRAQTYSATLAPTRFLLYLLYVTYGTDSDNEAVNYYMSKTIKIHVKTNERKSKARILADENYQPDKTTIPAKRRVFINKVATGLNLYSFLDFRNKHLEGRSIFIPNPELYGYIVDAYNSCGDKRLDIEEALEVVNIALTITGSYGISLSESYGATGLTKREQDLLIYKLVYYPNGKNNAGQVHISDYLVGFIIMLLSKQIRSMKEFYFRNNSETQYLELQRLENVIDEKNGEIERLKAELAKTEAQGERQRDEIKRLTAEIYKDNKDAIKPYASEISSLNARIRELEKDLETEKAKTPELNALREFAFEAQSDYIPAETPVTLAELIYGKMIIVVGGHVNWRNKMKSHYPDITFWDGHSVSLNNTIFDKADFTLFCTSNMSHKLYDKIVGYLRDKKFKFGYLGRSKNQELLEAEIVSILQDKM